MHSKFRLGSTALLVFVMWSWTGETFAQSAPARNERAQLQLAQAYLRDNSYTLAEFTLNELLRDYPQSPLAPEALYNLSVVLRLQDRADDAKKVQMTLVTKHPKSAWGQLILKTVDDKELSKLANDAYKQARTTHNPADAALANDLFVLYAKRFPADKDKLPEMTFKTAKFLRIEGDSVLGEKLLQELVRTGKDTNWGKMAAVLLGGPVVFVEQMDDFAAACRGADEQELFLEQALCYQAQMKTEDALRCQWLYGVCLADLGRHDEAVALWTKLLKDHPKSPLAPRVLFTLAKHRYGHKNVELARLDYQRLARDYPDTEYAKIARRWLKWLDHYDDDWADFEQRLRDAIAAITEGNGAIAFKLTGDWGDPSRAVRCRVALQNKDRFVIEAQLGAKGVLIANDVKGGWYHKFGEPFALRLDEKIPFGMPEFDFPIDPVTGKISTKFNWLTASSDGVAETPVLRLLPDHAARAVSSLQEYEHLTIRTKLLGEKKEHVVYRFETAGGEPVRVSVCEIEVNEEKKLESIRYTYWSDKNEKSVWTLSDVTAGGTLPESMLAVTLPKGVEVRAMKEMNPMDVMTQAFSLFGMFMEAMSGDEKK